MMNQSEVIWIEQWSCINVWGMSALYISVGMHQMWFDLKRGNDKWKQFYPHDVDTGISNIL